MGTAAGGMAVRLQEDGGWTPPSLWLPVSGALDSQPGRGLCFWNVGPPVCLGGEECRGKLVRQ